MQYLAPRRLVDLVLDILNKVQSSSEHVYFGLDNKFSYDAFEFMDFTNLKTMVQTFWNQDRLHNLEDVISPCKALCDVYPLDQPWGLRLLHIIDSAKKYGLYKPHHVVRVSNNCALCSDNHHKYDEPRDTFFNFNTRRGMFTVMITSSIINHVYESYGRFSSAALVDHEPLPSVALSQIISQHQPIHQKCRYYQADFDRLIRDMCCDMNPEMIDVLNSFGSNIYLQIVSKDDDIAYVDFDDPEDDEDTRDPSEENMDYEEYPDDVSDYAGWFLHARAEKLTSTISADYDSFIHYLK